MDATVNIERHCSIAESMRYEKTHKRRWKDFAERKISYIA